MALPMYALYEVGIVMAKILAKNKLEERAREERERGADTA
jgi:Sec-independent protein secretion pathway component TatC